MASKIWNLVRIPELRRRILFTLGALLVYRLGSVVPLPGLNLDQLAAYVQRLLGGSEPLFGIINAFSAGAFDNPTLFSLGVMPYISASIILSVLVKIIPALEALSKEGAAGQKKINQYTRYLTVPICMFQSLIVLNFVIFLPDLQLVPPDASPFFLGLKVMVVLTAGTLFLMWLGEQINEYGVGNGISLVIMVGIIDRVPTAVNQMLSTAGDPEKKWQVLFVLTAMWVAAIFTIVYITKGQRRIPIQQAKLTRGQRIYMGQRHYLPLKVNQAGVMPIIFASAIFLVPTWIGRILGWSFLETAFAGGTGFLYLTTYTALIFFFSFFWTTLMFQPNEIANNLKEYGSFVPGIRPGKKTAEYLDFVITRVTLAGSAFLAIIALVPNVIHESFNLSYGISAFLGGTSILIVVGVALDLVDKLNAHLVMHNYEELGRGGGGWARSRT